MERKVSFIFAVDASLKKASIFNKVFELANRKLKDDFGYELVPLPVVAPINISAAAKTNQSRRAAVNQKAKAEISKTGPPQAFCLVTTLTQQQRAIMPRTCRKRRDLAVIHAILMIIKLSGNVIEHRHLIASLNEIELFVVDSSGSNAYDLEHFLEKMKRERYILKERNSIIDSESLYSWGPRAYVEFPPKNMSEFLFTVTKLEY